MVFINYISNAVIPITIVIIIIYAFAEKIKIFDEFVIGSKEGAKIVVSLMPTLIGLFVAIGALRSSGLIDFILKLISPVLNAFSIPKEIMPLAILRPISGSASLAMGTDIMAKYGADSKIGLIASTIMGSTETTIYAIAIYTSCVKAKKTRGILFAALIGDIVRNGDFCNSLSIYVVRFLLTKIYK